MASGFETVLVANRGEIARRSSGPCSGSGSAGGRRALRGRRRPALRAGGRRGRAIGPAPPAQSYRDVDAVLEAAARTGRRPMHPGYGFLAENAEFARAGRGEPGWSGSARRRRRSSAMGDKISARNLMAAAGVPVSPGTPTRSADRRGGASAAAATIGYPLMVKAAAGGGGMGMAVAADEAALRAEFEGSGRSPSGCSATLRAARALLPPGTPRRGAGPRPRGRPGRGAGRAGLLGAATAPEGRRGEPFAGVGAELRSRMLAAAVQAGEAVGYRNAGTVECLLDPATRRVRLPGDEHPPAGRAPRHRGGVRRRPGRAAAAGRVPGRRQLRPGPRRPERPRDRAPGQRRGPERFLPGPGAITAWSEPPAKASGSTPATPPETP